jgi:hypothetical protein
LDTTLKAQSVFRQKARPAVETNVVAIVSHGQAYHLHHFLEPNLLRFEIRPEIQVARPVVGIVRLAMLEATNFYPAASRSMYRSSWVSTPSSKHCVWCKDGTVMRAFGMNGIER